MDTPTTKAELIHQVLVAAEELWIHAKAHKAYYETVTFSAATWEKFRSKIFLLYFYRSHYSGPS